MHGPAKLQLFFSILWMVSLDNSDFIFVYFYWFSGVCLIAFGQKSSKLSDFRMSDKKLHLLIIVIREISV